MTRRRRQPVATPEAPGIASIPYSGPIPAAGTRRAERYREALDFLSGKPEDFLRTCILLRDNRKAFPHLFGPNTRTYRKATEHLVWILSFLGVTFHVYTGGRGTSYEVDLRAGEAPRLPDAEIGRRTAAFLSALYKALLRTPDGSRDAEHIRNTLSTLPGTAKAQDTTPPPEAARPRKTTAGRREGRTPA